MKKVGDVLELISNVKENNGCLTLLINGKAASIWHEKKPTRMLTCKVLDIRYENQQAYLIVVPIHHTKVKMSVGQGTRLLMAQCGSIRKNFFLENEKMWNTTFHA